LAAINASLNGNHEQREKTEKASRKKFSVFGDNGNAPGKPEQEAEQSAQSEDQPWVARWATPIKALVLIWLLTCAGSIYHGLNLIAKDGNCNTKTLDKE
jgi:hypothetical protein